ncbi:MAG: flavodoxin [Bacteroidales bacterium]|nr:flavodoxin [Bacteroidales bacterium]
MKKFLLAMTLMAALCACTQKQNALVVYFSLSGPTYTSDGIVQLEKGNTQRFAEIIGEATGAELFRIERDTPYPDDFEAVCAVSEQELKDGIRPALKADIDTKPYDVIYVGWPCWCDTMPMCVLAFLESHNLSGKTIVPFTTHEGSGFGNGLEDLKKACPGATIAEGMELPGHEVKDARDRILAWLAQTAKAE